jgi:HK97 family phage prohead protease
MAKYSADQLKAMGAKGHAYRNPDGHYSFPIGDAEDLTNAIHAVGRAGADHDKIRAYIIRRAKAMGMSGKIPDNWSSDGSSRSDLLPIRDCLRAYRVEDLHLRSDGSGRVVEAYAAAFNVRTEIVDQDGHYHEELSPTAFTKTLADKGTAFGVLFNHGRTVDGVSSGELFMPIGVPLEVRADERGVWTATRYLSNPLADSVLDAIKQGAIKAQSFSGRFIKSVKTPARRGMLPVITRHEVSMREYGPAVFAAYPAAAILGTRTEEFIRMLLAQPDEKVQQWLQQFEGMEPLVLDEPGALSATPFGADAQADEPREHSARSNFAARVRAARIARHME